MKRSILGFAVFILLAFTHASLGGDKSANFTGTWKVNMQKSDFGPLFSPKTAQAKIDHQEPMLSITDTETNEQNESSTVESKFTTDSKPTSATLIAFPMEVKGAAKWDGSTLTFVGDGKFNGMDVHIAEKWEQNGDASTFTITRTLSAAMGTTTQTILLEK